ncbi:hypothetical protein LINPERHAP1_LOCUS1440 [Linum perenne]
MVALIATACCLLHNFIRKEGGLDVFEQAYVPLYNEEANVADNLEHNISRVEASGEWTESRVNLAHQMWANRANQSRNL